MIQVVHLSPQLLESAGLGIFESGLFLLEALAPLSKLRQELVGVLLACGFDLQRIGALAGLSLQAVDRRASLRKGRLALR
jgi:hypothetical protein